MRKTRSARRMRKMLVVVAALTLILGMAIGGTVAWLQDSSEQVTNTFTASAIDVSLAETVPANKTAQMIPGATIKKDPKVTVDNADVDAWVFVKITESANLNSFISYKIADGWTRVTGVENVYYRHVGKGDATKTFSVLKDDQVKVLTTVKKEDMTGTFTNPTMAFDAYVIQSENLVNTSGTPLTETDIATIWGMVSAN